MNPKGERVRAKFRYARGDYEGIAAVRERHRDGKAVRVRPDDWTHDIWIGTEEIVGDAQT